MSVVPVGPFDILCILKLPAGTFHVAFFQEKPLPGPILPAESITLVRLKSKMHHTTGAATFEGAQRHLDDLRLKIDVPDRNVVRGEWIEVDDPVNVWFLQNWLNDVSLQVRLREAGLL